MLDTGPKLQHIIPLPNTKPAPAMYANKLLDNYINPLKTKRRPLYLKTQSYRAVNTFHLCYKNQSVYAVSGTSRCLFSDKYKTHKY